MTNFQVSLMLYMYTCMYMYMYMYIYKLTDMYMDKRSQDICTYSNEKASVEMFMYHVCIICTMCVLVIPATLVYLLLALPSLLHFSLFNFLNGYIFLFVRIKMVHCTVYSTLLTYYKCTCMFKGYIVSKLLHYQSICALKKISGVNLCPTCDKRSRQS